MQDREYRCANFTYNYRHYENLDFDFIEPQTHDVYELIFIKHGELSYVIEDRTYIARENDIIFTRPGFLHRIDFLDHSIYERYDILFDEKIILPDIFRKMPHDADVLHLKNYKRIEELFEKMNFYCENFKGVALENILEHLIEEIFYNIVLSNEQAQERDYISNPLMTKAIHFIEENLSDSLSLEKICDELFITKSYLNKIFKRYLGMSPAKYIVSKRLIAAQKEIRNGESPTQVFSKFGFLEYSTFYRNYKDYFGYSPSEENDRIIIRRIDG